MGYYSDYVGEFHLSKHPSKKIRDDIKKRIETIFGKYTIGEQNINYSGDVYYDYDNNTIVPTEINMKGYEFESHVKTIANILKPLGISLKGEVFRHGEESDDNERLFFKKGKLYSSIGTIVYKNPKEV